MKNFGTLLALLAVSASHVVSLPHEGNAPRGQPDARLSLLARAAKEGKDKGAAASANNGTQVAVNGTANANDGAAKGNGKGKKGNGQDAAALAANGTANANNGTANAGKDNGKGKKGKDAKGQAGQNNKNNTGNAASNANSNGQSLIDQLITDLEGQLGIDVNGDGKAGAGQINVADLLKLLGARDEQPEHADAEKRRSGRSLSGQAIADLEGQLGVDLNGDGKVGAGAAAGKLGVDDPFKLGARDEQPEQADVEKRQAKGQGKGKGKGNGRGKGKGKGKGNAAAAAAASSSSAAAAASSSAAAAAAAAATASSAASDPAVATATDVAAAAVATDAAVEAADA